MAVAFACTLVLPSQNLQGKEVLKGDKRNKVTKGRFFNRCPFANYDMYRIPGGWTGFDKIYVKNTGTFDNEFHYWSYHYHPDKPTALTNAWFKLKVGESERRHFSSERGTNDIYYMTAFDVKSNRSDCVGFSKQYNMYRPKYTTDGYGDKIWIIEGYAENGYFSEQLKLELRSYKNGNLLIKTPIRISQEGLPYTASFYFKIIAEENALNVITPVTSPAGITFSMNWLQ